MSKAIKITLLTLKILLGLVFIFSAVAKMLGIDQFEVYVYSFGFFSMNWAFFLARICIAGEFLLGVGLVSNLCNRLTTTVTLLVLLLFTIFLSYTALIGRTDNCQCFGSLVEISPVKSIIKNAVLIVLTLLVRRVPSFNWRPKWYLWAIAIVAPFAAVFILSPLDSWMFKQKGAPYNEKYYNETFKSSEVFQQADLGEGRKLVAFVTPHCPYCKMALQKIETFQRRHDLDSNAIVYCVPQSMDTVSVDYRPFYLNDTAFIYITYGNRPLLMLVQDGEPKETYHYRNINEAEIVAFLD